MEEKKKYRNFPRNPLEESLAVPQKIADEMGGKPFKRLLLAEALGTTPSSSNFVYILSSSYQYGLTEGTEKASDIKLTELGEAATQTEDAQARLAALREAAMRPEVFGAFYKDYQDKKVPSPEMMGKILVAEYDVPKDYAEECAQLILANGRFAGLVRDISGSPHVLFDTPPAPEEEPQEEAEAPEEEAPAVKEEVVVKDQKPPEPEPPQTAGEDKKPKPIFIGHGKNHLPLEKIEKVLTTLHVPYKVATEEANLGRPIPLKVRDTMYQCGSAILIFTCDEKFFDEQSNVVWRPSENVVHELGAASLLYQDRIVIFKEKDIHFPTNFQSIGYIEFDADSVDSKAMDLLKELVGFGLVKVLPV